MVRCVTLLGLDETQFQASGFGWQGFGTQLLLEFVVRLTSETEQDSMLLTASCLTLMQNLRMTNTGRTWQDMAGRS